MATLTRASKELFRRSPDERYQTLPELIRHCEEQKEQSIDRWKLPSEIVPELDGNGITLSLNDDGVYRLNNWSFSQLCQLATVSRDTVNKLSPKTAVQALKETLPGGTKPLQCLTMDRTLRSLHGASYTRLFNADVLGVVQEFAEDFQPPQEAFDGGTGLYCGEQDMFCFLIDPTGWTEIKGEAFAPGFFLWNSEVGKRTVGVQTFWFQAICQNHIVWDAVEVVEFKRKHTAHVHESLDQIRSIVRNLVKKRDERRDGFAKVMEKAMRERLGDDAEEVVKILRKHGIQNNVAKEATEMAKRQGKFTIFSLVDALTRMATSMQNAGDRTEADAKASQLLQLVA